MRVIINGVERKPRRYFDLLMVPSCAETAITGAQVTRTKTPCLESARCKCDGDCPFDCHPSQKGGDRG